MTQGHIATKKLTVKSLIFEFIQHRIIMKKILLYGILFCIPYAVFSQSQEDLIQQVKAHPDKVESASILQRIGASNPDYRQLEDLYKGLDRKVKKSSHGKFAKHYIDALKKTTPGKKAPGITQFNLAGEPYSLQDLRGKYVLISFWASWNTASRQETPFYKEIYNEFKDQNFEILGVSFDSEFNAWNNYIQENELTWKHISDLQNMNNGAALGYGIKAIPQNVLVDPDGVVVARNLRGEGLREKLHELLN